MYTLIAQNKYGQQIELTHNEAYVIESIEGLDPPEAVINTTRNANADGSVFNSAYVDNRQIIITLAINGPAETNRIQLYKYFKNKYPIRLYYQNNTRNVYIDGYCKNIQIEFFNKKQIAQITIICPEPFFNGTEDEIINFSSVTAEFEFPFSVEESANLLKYPYDYTTSTKNGITYTDNGDGTITANGTATAYSDFALESRIDTDTPFTLPDGTYIISGCPEGGGTSTYRILVGKTVDGAWSTIVGDGGSGATFEYDSSMGNLGVVIAVYNGTTVDNVTFKPMIRAASIEDDTYMEYGEPPGEIEFGEILIEQEKNISNSGDVETGVEIYLRARGPLSNPAIYNVDTNEYFKLTLSMVQGDEVYINTKKKQKTVQLTHNGETTNIIGQLVSGSTWFTLNPGDNLFTTTADTSPENLDAYCIITDQFEGV